MNLIKDAGHVLATMAPTIATAVGGPFAGMAVAKLESLFGIDPAASEDCKQAQIENALVTATPDQLLALKKADNDFKVQMRELGIKEQELAYADTANARAREIAVKDWTPKILAFTVTVGFFGVLGWMLHGGIPKDGGGEALLVLLGALGTAWGSIISYYYGSSAGSSHKDDTIQQALAKK